ncbi:uncharacterized protein LTHEOB_9422 [Neofusicoccum parvum]|nr:uncharacterized protein LTHEOB_9422 [Neofusicoccum parvum]
MSYICLIWCLKGSVLFFYYRLTIGLKEQKIVRVLAVAVVLSFLAMIFEILLQCRPVEKNWQIKPYAGDSCTLIYVRYYLLLVLNVSTDLGLMAFIPTPILWKAQIPIRRKLMVAVLLFSSVFIVVAAIIRCVMSVNEIRKIGTSGAWAIRETFVSIFVVNAPAIKPLFSRNQWNKSSKGTSGSTSRTGPKLSRTPQGDEVELRSGTYWSNKDGSSVRDVERGSASGGSDDNIIEPKDGLRINVTTAFATSTEQGSKLEEVEGEHRWSGAMGKAENRKTRDGWTRLGDMSRGETNTTVVADMRGS